MVCEDEKDTLNKTKCLIKPSSLANPIIPLISNIEPHPQTPPMVAPQSHVELPLAAPVPLPSKIDSIPIKKSTKVNNVGEMEEVQLDFNKIQETIVIKNTHETYKNLLVKINELKKKYIEAVSTANQFKEKYKIKDIKGLSDLSDSEDIEDIEIENIEDTEGEEEEDLD